jgi:hypothetical protein
MYLMLICQLRTSGPLASRRRVFQKLPTTYGSDGARQTVISAWVWARLGFGGSLLPIAASRSTRSTICRSLTSRIVENDPAPASGLL